MINERYQFSGVCRHDNKRISGYLWKNKGYYISNETQDLIEVDPATIEPVRVKPIFVPDLTLPDMIYCPNCNYDLMGGIETDAEHDPPYCWECGMALDWPKRK